MKYLSLKPGTLLSPVPAVLVSCADENGRPNALTVAWAGTVCSDPPTVSVSIRPGRYSHGLISRTKEFVINLAGEEMLPHVDYCGVRSGRDEDKLAARGLKCVPAEGLEYAPAIDGAPVHLACRGADPPPGQPRHVRRADRVPPGAGGPCGRKRRRAP